MRSRGSLLALLAVALLATPCLSVGHRTMVKTTESPTPEFSVSTASVYTDIATGDNTEAITFEFETDAECDLQVQYRCYLSGMPNAVWYGDFTSISAGEYVNGIFGWKTARNFSGTMTDVYSFVVEEAFLRDVADIALSASFVVDSRYRLRYLNAAGDTVTTGFSYMESVVDERAVDITAPVKLANGSCTAVNFQGFVQTLIVLTGFQADDGKDVDILGFEVRVSDQATDEILYESPSQTVTVFGAGADYGGVVARLSGFIATWIANGYRYLDVEVRLTDGHSNQTGWMLIDTVDLENPLAP